MLISFQSIDHLINPQRRDPITLEPQTVHLWGMELDGSSWGVKRCSGWLDEGERRRAARLVREQDRQRYVVAHGALRAILSRYLGISPGLVSLGCTESGKPFVTGTRGPGITFNLSHAHGRALIAVSNVQEVGVDLELVRSEVDVVKLSKRYFSPPEHASIMQSTEEQRAMMFFRYWVVKEAVLKAQGIGLRGLTSCQVVFGTDALEAEVLIRGTSRPQPEVKARLLSCGQGWEAAVAAQQLDSVRQWS